MHIHPQQRHIITSIRPLPSPTTPYHIRPSPSPPLLHTPPPRYVGIFSAAFAASRSLIPGPEEQQSGHQEATMGRVAAYTHHFPRRWRGR